MAGKYADFQITRPLVFLCEGPADAAFVREALIHGDAAAAANIDFARVQDAETGGLKPGGISALVAASISAGLFGGLKEAGGLT